MGDCKQSDWAWLAGLLDGEGYIGITKIKNPPYSNIPNYFATISVGMTSKITIDYILRKFRVGSQNCARLRHRSKPLYVWQCKSNDVRHLLTNTIPYMITKKQQARRVLDFIQEKVNYHGLTVPDRELEKREKMWIELKNLNTRGVSI